VYCFGQSISDDLPRSQFHVNQSIDQIYHDAISLQIFFFSILVYLTGQFQKSIQNISILMNVFKVDIK